MTKLLISFSEVRELLMASGLRKREAEALLKANTPKPLQHGLHSRRRWSRSIVVDYCANLPQNGFALGEGCEGCTTTAPPSHG